MNKDHNDDLMNDHDQENTVNTCCDMTQTKIREQIISEVVVVPSRIIHVYTCTHISKFESINPRQFCSFYFFVQKLVHISCMHARQIC